MDITELHNRKVAIVGADSVGASIAYALTIVLLMEYCTNVGLE